MRAFEQLLAQVNAHMEKEGRARLTMAELALGFIQVANEAMCRPIRRLTEVCYLSSYLIGMIFGPYDSWYNL